MDDANRALSDAGSTENRLRLFLARFVAKIGKNTNLMRLDALASGVLQENMTMDALLAFRSELHRCLREAGAALDEKFGLPHGQGSQLLIRTHAMTRGMWQSF
jgi:hypothetical protein